MPTHHHHHAIVTGASRGIGRAIAVQLGTLGAKVVINFNSNQGAADEAAMLVREAGGEALTVQADVASTDDHARLLDAAIEKFGPVTLLVNNAGVAPKVRADVLDMPADSYDFVMNTNLRGPFLLTQRVAKHMLAPGNNSPITTGTSDGSQADFSGRAVINISSISAYTAHVNRAEYSLSKAGMAMMTQVFAARLADEGINVYEIRPGVIATDMTGPVKAKYDKLILEDRPGITPIRRWGTPDDIAQAVRALAENRFPFSTGEVFNIDGGFHLKTL